MQQYEKAQDGIAERGMEVYIPGPMGPHFRLRGKMTGIQDNSIDSLTFNYKNLSKDERIEFRELIQSTKVSMKVHLPRDGSAPLAKAGWIQAAYLMAFYTFGYRYIFQTSVQPIYEYIHNSYESIRPQSKNDTIRVIESKSCCHKYPVVELMVPINADRPLFIRVSMLQYHIHLPISCNEDVLNTYLNQQIADLDKHLPVLSEQDAVIGCKIYCDKAKFHTCAWDQILASPKLPNPSTVE